VRLALCGLLWLTAGTALGTVQAQQSVQTPQTAQAQATQTRTAGQTQAAQEQQAPAAGPALTAAQEARAQAVGRTIRCPVCQGLPITESPSDLSQSMLRDLRGQVAAGRSDDQITTYFAQRYGDTVLLDPPRRGVNLLLWAGITDCP